jgi:uncharacterized protein involved in exopolysaccharide biosynthesis
MQIRDFRTFPVLAALIGASIGTAMYLRAPALYASSSTIRISGGSVADASSDASPAFLDGLTRALSAAETRAATSVTVRKSGGDSSFVRITHTAHDAKRAQQVVTQLVTATINGSGDAIARATIVEPPALPTTPRKAHGAASVYLGAGLGLVLGAAFVGVRRVIGSRRAA